MYIKAIKLHPLNQFILILTDWTFKDMTKTLSFGVKSVHEWPLLSIQDLHPQHIKSWASLWGLTATHIPLWGSKYKARCHKQFKKLYIHKEDWVLLPIIPRYIRSRDLPLASILSSTSLFACFACEYLYFDLALKGDPNTHPTLSQTNLFCAIQCVTKSNLSSCRALLTHSSEVSALGNTPTAGTDDIRASQ